MNRIVAAVVVIGLAVLATAGTTFAQTTRAHMLKVCLGNWIWTWIVLPGLKTWLVWRNSPVSETFFVNAVLSAFESP